MAGGTSDGTDGRGLRPLGAVETAVPWGAHLLHLYEDAEELRSVVGRYVRAGLEGGERCALVLGGSTAGFVAALEEAVPGLAARRHEGRVVLLPAEELYGVGAEIDAAATLARWADLEARARADGLAGLRAWGDVSGVAERCLGGCVRYCAAFNDLAASRRVVALCSCRADGLTAEAAVRLASCHSGAVLTGAGRPPALAEPAASQRDRLGFEALVDQSRHGVLVLRHGRVLYANPALCELLGLGAGELAATTLRDLAGLVTGRSVAQVEGDVEDLVAGRRDIGPVEVLLRVAGGAPRWVELIAQRIEWPGGPALQVLVVDVHDRHVAQEERDSAVASLRESEARYRALVERSPCSILVVQGGRYVFANPAAAAMLGHGGPSELVGREVLETIEPSQRELIRGRMGRVVDGARNEPVELGLCRPDGTTLWVESRSVPITLEGEPAALIIGTDLTAWKRAQRELRQSEEMARALLDVPSHLAALLDEEGRFLDVNDTFCARVGLSKGGILGQSLEGVFPPAVAAARRARLEAALASGRAVRFEDRRGELCYDSTVFPVPAEAGRPRRVAVVAYDISERKRAEAEVSRTRDELRRLSIALQDAREAERARIAREIHDDLGQQLTALKMDLRWVEGRCGGGDAVAERLGAAVGLVESMTAAVRRIGSELRPGLLDHLGLAAALEWQAEELERSSGIACAVVPDAEGREPPAAAATVLFRACQEALDNVARHASASSVEVSLRAEAGAFVVEVVDDGVGFDPVADAASEGLGIVGMKVRLAALGGDTAVASAPGQGTRVTLRVPLDRA